MAGPALSRRDAHHAIHQAAFDEQERLTRLLRHSVRAGEHGQALQLASVLIEHWQTHTLQHAEAEESGWYREVTAARPELHADVVALTRDHELLRILLNEIQGLLARYGMTSGIVERFEAMLLLNAIHSREEEYRLLGGDDHVDLYAMPEGTLQPEVSASTTTGATNKGISPLSVAHPALYARLVAHLRARGLGPGDVLATTWDDGQQKVMRIACGARFSVTKEWVVPEDSDSEATEILLRDSSAWCEEVVKADDQRRIASQFPRTP